MNVTTAWVPAIKTILQQKPVFTNKTGNLLLSVYCAGNAVWIVTETVGGTCVLLRSVYTPNAEVGIIKSVVTEEGFEARIKTVIGFFDLRLQLLEGTDLLFRCTTTFTPLQTLLIPFWPRDLFIANKRSSIVPQGEVHITQTGTRSGLQYISLDKPAAGSLLYFQNLTSLNEYCEITGTSLADTVAGKWPELGFALPSSPENPLPKNKAVVLSDVFLAFNTTICKNIFDHSKQFFNFLAAVYKHLPKPQTEYHPWLEILRNGLQDLQFNTACWSHANGNDYLNAYVCDYKTPPEIMVQLAVLLPLLDYKKWSKEDLPAIEKIKAGLSAFYKEELGTVVRWLPSQEKNLDNKEEQLNAVVMDSWYLHHPLLNLARIALENKDRTAKKLFLDSLPFVMKVARHFKYEWPVFYNIKTLEVIKAETKPGEGGEHDVAGLYAHIMLQAWKLTKHRKYLTEAEKAARTLARNKFKIFYQANNTAFAANAMLTLFKETGKEIYLDTAYLCLANIFKNVQLWECNYGYAKNYSTFFAVFPLNDAPYTAAYEEQEVFAAIQQFISDTGGIDLLPAVSLLLAEFVRYLIQRAYFYYPANLPAVMLSKKVKTGELDPKLWIALEDIHDGWQQSGTVGQEVYGAGVAFGIVPRHYYYIKNQSFLIYIDYPSGGLRVGKKKTVSFYVKGHHEMCCRLLIINTGKTTLPSFTVHTSRGKAKEKVNAVMLKDGNIEYVVFGDRRVQIQWR